MLDAAPLAPVGAEAGFEEQLVRHGRAPGRLLHALAESMEIGAQFRRRDVRTVRPAGRVRCAGSAADDFVVARLAASLGAAEDACALTRNLLIPEHVDLVARRQLERQPQGAVA